MQGAEKTGQASHKIVELLYLHERVGGVEASDTHSTRRIMILYALTRPYYPVPNRLARVTTGEVAFADKKDGHKSRRKDLHCARSSLVQFNNAAICDIADRVPS